MLIARILTVVLLAALAPTPATAAPIVYTDRAAFDAAVGVTTPVHFTAGFCDPPPFPPDRSSCYYGNVLNVSAMNAAQAVIPLVDELFVGIDWAKPTVSVINPVTAIGFDVTTNRGWFQDTGVSVMTLSGSEAGAIFFGDPYEITARHSFFGFVFEEPTTATDVIRTPEIWKMVDGRPVSAQYSVTNVVAQPVPEPGVMTLLFLGAGGLGAARWISRRRRAVEV
jgi:hypothetical protein